MSKNLVIVESPAKANTLKKYLGKDFEVIASYGHIRDLVPKTGAVEPDNGFAMHYQLIERNTKHAQAILKAIKTHDQLYLATDPDREGEAIAWHIHEFLQSKNVLKNKTVHRITFHEITEQAVKKAVNGPTELATHLVDAQQARRALDYLVGFTLSPLLWKKVRRGLSAGRVQSPALRLIVERENEIRAFETQEYWTITAELVHQKETFTAKLINYQKEKLKQFSITCEDSAKEVKEMLLKSAKGKLLVTKIEKKERKKNPSAPFITSTLQQEAAHKLGFTAQRTMRIAQQLYEGIDIGSGPVGLITYMRTDSTTLANEALQAIRQLITSQYGKTLLPSQPRRFRTKSKNAQEAHEAIRPTEAGRLPAALKDHLNTEQYRLYELIWKRTIASQMQHAVLELHTIDLQGGVGNDYRSSGTTIKKAGFMSVYLETPDAAKDMINDTETTLLPELTVGDYITLNDIKPTQHFTEPPPRYNEASLIKTLESHNIGRPSTYVPIITTLQHREYVILEKKRFYPTDVGCVVNQFLTTHFYQYVDYDFTAQLEEDLDAIARGEKNRVPVLAHFWGPFKKRTEHVESNVQRAEVTQETIDENCPKCDKVLIKRLGKRGRFVGCSGYPDCDYTRNVNGDSTDNEPQIVADRSCPECQAMLHIKMGRYGKFIGCSQYPTCKYIESLEKPSHTDVQCPECKKGELVQRKSRYGKIFYSCDKYPDCKYAIWYPPTNTTCPSCAWPILMVKTTKRRGKEQVCPRKTCGYANPVSE